MSPVVKSKKYSPNRKLFEGNCFKSVISKKIVELNIQKQNDVNNQGVAQPVIASEIVEDKNFDIDLSRFITNEDIVVNINHLGLNETKRKQNNL